MFCLIVSPRTFRLMWNSRAQWTAESAAGVKHSQVQPRDGSLKRGEAFQMLEDCLKESEKNCDIRIRAIMLRLESMRQHCKHKFLSHLEYGRGLQGHSGIRGD